MKRQKKKKKTSFPHQIISYEREMKQRVNSENEVGGKKETHKANQLFFVVYRKLWLSSTSHFSLCFCFFSSQLFSLTLSISAHDLAGAAEARLNCAISYMFTLLASFWAYFPPNISPHIILHFLYNDMLSLISLCKPFLGLRIRIQ